MHNLRTLAKGIILFLVLVFCVLPATAAQLQQHYIFAVMPSAPPVTMHTRWAPFVERLRRDTGLDFRLTVYEQMPEFEMDISKGAPDFLFANPLQEVVAHEAQGYIPLVRGGGLIAAELFVRRDSSIMSVNDLLGKKIALVGNKNL